jgi:hypothetical protein
MYLLLPAYCISHVVAVVDYLSASGKKVDMIIMQNNLSVMEISTAK